MPHGKDGGVCASVCSICAGLIRISAVAMAIVISYVLSAIRNQQQLQKHAHKQGDN